MKLHDLLRQESANLALLIGNGINRYEATVGGNSWDELLGELARQHLDPLHSDVPQGISLTEFYDVLDLSTPRQKGSTGLQKQFCDLMADWRHQSQHRRVGEWARAHDVPVLTTNFEDSIGKSVNCKLQRVGRLKFTAFYPWDSCYCEDGTSDPCAGFAVWHINGMQRYRQSVRLGLTHYMGSVERARPWLHKGSNRLFSGGPVDAWPGASTWLQILFHKPILIFGLTLGQNEVFLRWLLIERAKYFQAFPARRQAAWYVHPGIEEDLGKLMFLKAVGVSTLPVADYEEIYGQETWTVANSS